MMRKTVSTSSFVAGFVSEQKNKREMNKFGFRKAYPNVRDWVAVIIFVYEDRMLFVSLLSLGSNPRNELSWCGEKQRAFNSFCEKEKTEGEIKKQSELRLTLSV